MVAAALRPAEGDMTTRSRVLTRAGPFTLLLGGTVVLAVVAVFLPSPTGHWQGHALSASAAAGQLVAVLAAAWWADGALPGIGRLLAAVVGVGLALETGGNALAARAMWRTSYSDDMAGLVGPTYPGFVLGHELAEIGDLVVTVGGFALATVLGLARRVPVAVAVVAIVLLMVPPWIMPALSTILVIAWLAAFRPQAVAGRVTPAPA
jgi:hypothetical protein